MIHKGHKVGQREARSLIGQFKGQRISIGIDSTIENVGSSIPGDLDDSPFCGIARSEIDRRQIDRCYDWFAA